MKIKTMILIVVVFGLSLIGCSGSKKNVEVHSSGNSPWLTNLEQAQAESAKTGKPIFVDFTGSDWCHWCIKLHDEVLSKQEFLDYAKEELVLVLLDFPKNIKQSSEVKDYNQKLAQKYGIRGFPTILLLDQNAEVIAQTGYQEGGAKAYVEHLKSLLN